MSLWSLIISHALLHSLVTLLRSRLAEAMAWKNLVLASPSRSQCVFDLCFQYSSSCLRTLLKFSLASWYLRIHNSLLLSWLVSISFLYSTIDLLKRYVSLAPHSSKSYEHNLILDNNGAHHSLFQALLTTSLRSCSSNQAFSNLKFLYSYSISLLTSVSMIDEWYDLSTISLMHLYCGNCFSHRWLAKAQSILSSAWSDSLRPFIQVYG
jgi:hypothetical protein